MTEQNIKARKKQLELREQELSVEKAEVDLRKSQLELEDTEHAYRWSSAAKESRTGVFLFDDEVNHSNCAYFSGQLRRWHATHPGEPIEIILNTPGGSVFAGLALYDELRTLSEVHGHKITTRVRGYAASFGAVLLQAGDERYIGAESHLMIHEISSLSIGKLHEQENELEFTKKLNLRLFAIMASRTGGKWTGPKLYAKAKAKDLWLTSTEAVEWGLADGIA